MPLEWSPHVSFRGLGATFVLVAGNQDALDEIAQECRDVGSDVTTVNKRPTDEVACAKMVQVAVDAYDALDILVVASGMNKVALINDMEPETFTSVMDVNVTQSWLLARAASAQMKKQGNGGKIVLVSSARGLFGPSRWLHRLLRVQSRCRRDHKGAWLRVGANRDNGNAIAPTVFRSP